MDILTCIFIFLMLWLPSLLSDRGINLTYFISKNEVMMLKCEIPDDFCCSHINKIEFFKYGECVCTFEDCRPFFDVPLQREDTWFYRCGCSIGEIRKTHLITTELRETDYGNWSCACSCGDVTCRSDTIPILPPDSHEENDIAPRFIHDTWWSKLYYSWVVGIVPVAIMGMLCMVQCYRCYIYRRVKTEGRDCQERGLELFVQNTRPLAGVELNMCCISGKKRSSSNIKFTRNNVIVCETKMDGNKQQYKCKICKEGIYMLTIENTTLNDQGLWRCKAAYDLSNPVAIEVITASTSGPSTSFEPYSSSSTYSISNIKTWIYWAAGLVVIILIVGAFVICCKYTNENTYGKRVLDILLVERNIMTTVAALHIHSANGSGLQSNSSTYQQQNSEPLGWVRSLSAEAGLCKRERPSVSTKGATEVPQDEKEEVEEENYYESYNHGNDESTSVV